jgi:hypothetical protein
MFIRDKSAATLCYPYHNNVKMFRTLKTYLFISLACCSLSIARPQNQPSDAITVAPQSGVQTGPPLQTTYQSISGLTDNSVTTTVIGGTTTGQCISHWYQSLLIISVLPVWFCAASETAAACKSCPTATGETSCNGGFNALVLLPLVAAPGFFLPPPEGLPTLTIDNGEPRRYTPPPTPTPEPKTSTMSTPTPTPTPSLTSEPPPELSCIAATNKVADNAHPSLTTESLGGTQTAVEQPNPLVASAMPYLPLQLIQPGGMGICGGGGSNSRYFTSGFYQFGNTYTRDDALGAVTEFCATLSRNSSTLGPDGKQGVDNKDVKRKAEVRCCVERRFRHGG